MNGFRNITIAALSALLILSALAAPTQAQLHEYGDAPEGEIAYPLTGVGGLFPTCWDPGGGYVRHLNNMGTLAWFGPGYDLEPDGNAGICPTIPYEQDECWEPLDGDAGLEIVTAFTIHQNQVIPCGQTPPVSLGSICERIQWGSQIEMEVHNGFPFPMSINMLFDWNQDGEWGGEGLCGPGVYAREHAVWNLPVPGNFHGLLSALNPPDLQLGSRAGYVWVRFSLSEENAVQVPDWNGAQDFELGETEDYLLWIEPSEGMAEYGDAPEDAVAYPGTAVMGAFPTCLGGGPAGHIRHVTLQDAYLGDNVDQEPNGNAGICSFVAYDLDECAAPSDAGLSIVGPYTITPGGGSVMLCSGSNGRPLGRPCHVAQWGRHLDMQVHNGLARDLYLSVLADWTRDGTWDDAVTCADGSTGVEQVVLNFVVPGGYTGPASALGLPDFKILAGEGFAWFRFTLSESAVPADWSGEGDFELGETEDYLLRIVEDATDAPALGAAGDLRLSPSRPNPFNPRTVIAFSLERPGRVRATIHDTRGARVATLIDGERGAGSHELAWEGRDDAGGTLPSGVYVLRLEAGGEVRTEKLALLK